MQDGHRLLAYKLLMGYVWAYKECGEARKSGDFTKMIHFYGTAFQNFANMNAVFKAVPEQDGQLWEDETN